MSMYNEKNVLHVIVGKNETYVAEDVLIDNYADLNDGNVAIIDQDNKVRDTDAGTILLNSEVIRFATRIGTNLVYTPKFKLADVTSITSIGYTAAVQQITYLGYVGSGTANIEAIDENEYIVRILLEGNTSLFGNKQMYKFGAYKSDASATSAEVAIGLVDNLTHNFSREPQTTIQFDAICNNAGAAITGTGTVSITNGTKVLTANTDVDAIMSVGDYIRLGSTAVTGTMYKIMSMDTTANTLVLDRPYTGTTLASNAEANHEYVTAALGAAALWGIKMTGVAYTNFVPGVFNYEIPKFQVEPQDCGTTTVTYSTAANPGVGVYGQIAELEWFAQGNLGKIFRVDTPPVTLHTQAASASTYETITMQYKVRPSGSTSVTGTTPDSFGELVLAFVVGSDCGDKIFATLDEWGQANGFAALTAW